VVALQPQGSSDGFRVRRLDEDNVRSGGRKAVEDHGGVDGRHGGVTDHPAIVRLTSAQSDGLYKLFCTHQQRGRAALGSKRQTTMAKLTRERKVKEKRELKEEKKAAAAAAKAAGTYSYDGEPVEAPEIRTDPADPADEAVLADSTVGASSEDR